MSNEVSYPLTLNSEAFNGLKEDFNQILRRTLSMMIQKDGEKAELKISLKITLTQSRVPDGYDEDMEREIILPKLEHKVTSVMQYKEEKSGILGGANYELVWDKEKMDYVLRPIDGAQLSLFEEEKQEESADD